MAKELGVRGFHSSSEEQRTDLRAVLNGNHSQTLVGGLHYALKKRQSCSAERAAIFQMK